MAAASLRVLGPREAALLAAERAVLAEAREALAALDADERNLAALRQAAADLDELFLLVVVGEFNAGKSALLNALLGGPFVEEGVTPTTAQITILRYGDEPQARPLADGTVERLLPAPLLREIAIVDTPGTNAIIRRHEELTREFIPRSDLVLFVTSVDRPFTETERAFMEHIRAWGKKVVIVLNKIDLLQDDAQLAQVRSFVADGVARLLGFTPEVYAVSTRLAFRAKTEALTPAERHDLWQRSRFEALERYLSETLDAAERVRLKLLTPLAVAGRVVREEFERTRTRLEVLRGDLRGTDAIGGELDLYREDMRRDFTQRLHEVENVVYELNDRADAFFDETLRLGRVFDLFNADRLRADFERRVIADSARRIDAAVQALVDWLLEREQRLWREVAEYVGGRAAAPPAEPDGAVPDEEPALSGAKGRRTNDGSGRASVIRPFVVPGAPGENWSFAQERRRMLDTLARASGQALRHYDADSEARRWSLSMREAVTQTALAQVGALSLGTAVVALIGTTAADVTGVLAASVLAGLGLYIIPLRRRQARAQFHQKTDDLRRRLKEGMARQFEAELERSVQRIRDVVAPYARRVRAEHERLRAAADRLTALQHQFRDLRARAERELPASVPVAAPSLHVPAQGTPSAE
jgi:small GTP-binding protein